MYVLCSCNLDLQLGARNLYKYLSRDFFLLLSRIEGVTKRFTALRKPLTVFAKPTRFLADVPAHTHRTWSKELAKLSIAKSQVSAR